MTSSISPVVSNNVGNDPFINDYNKLEQDIAMMKKYMAQLEADTQALKDLLDQILATAKKNPDQAWMMFVQKLMPAIMNLQGDQPLIVSGKLNITSDYGNLISLAQKCFNDLGNLASGDVSKLTPEQYQDALDLLSIVQLFDGLNNSNVAGGVVDGYTDPNTISDMKNQFDSLKNVFFGANGSEDVKTMIANLYNDWKNNGSLNPNIKTAMDSFTQAGADVSSSSQSLQTQMQFVTGNYQKVLGTASDSLQETQKGVMAMINNQKSS